MHVRGPPILKLAVFLDQVLISILQVLVSLLQVLGSC